MSSNFRQIRLLTTELAALECLKHQCLHFFSVGIDPILFKVECYINMHNILHEFEFWPNGTTDCGVSCPWASKKLITFSRLLLIWSSLNLQVTKTCIKSWTSSNFSQIRTLIAEIVSCICKKQQCIIIFRSSQIRGILSVAKLLTNASLFIFDWIIKVAGNKDMHKNLQEFDFWHIQTADIVELIGPEKNNCSLTWKLFRIF